MKYDFAKILKIIHESNVIVPRIQFVAEPKFSLPLPPPKELAPTERREKPMEVTTLAATIGDISLIQYFAKDQEHLLQYRQQEQHLQWRYIRKLVRYNKNRNKSKTNTHNNWKT